MRKKLFWTDPTYKPGPKLKGDTKTDYLIAGGGVVGLFTAYFLLKRGVKNIVVIEKETVGSGSAGHSAGMLIAEEIETARWRELVRLYGNRLASLYLKVQEDAEKEVAKLIRKEKIKCDYGKYDFLIVSEWSHRKLMNELKLRKPLGSHYKLLEGKKFEQEFRTPAFHEGAVVEKSISVNPVKLLHGFAKYLKKKGVLIYEYTPLIATKGNIGMTPKGNISFKQIVYARGTHEKYPKLKNVMTTVSITRPLSLKELNQLELADKDMFLDDQHQSYHYGKITKDNRLLMGYGDVVTDLAETDVPLHAPHIRNIKRFIKRVVGKSIPLKYAWTSIYSLSKQKLPIVRIKRNRTTIAGTGTQITSIALAEYAASVLTGHKHPLQSLFK